MRLAPLALALVASTAHAQINAHKGLSGYIQPVNGGYTAAQYTATNNPRCVGGTIGSTHYLGVSPFYIGIGNAAGEQFSLSVGSPAVTNTTSLIIDSASKLLAAAYVVQEDGGYSSLTSTEKLFLGFQAGYASVMLSQTTGVQCTPQTTGTVNGCLQLPAAGAATFTGNVAGASSGTLGTAVPSGVYTFTFSDTETRSVTVGTVGAGISSTAAVWTGALSAGTITTASYACTAGTNGTCYSSYIPLYYQVFYYDGGQLENLFATRSEINNLAADAIGTKYDTAFGITGSQVVQGNLVHQAFFFNQAMIAGGVYTTEQYYSQFLRGILSGSLLMLGALGQNEVCAWDGCATGPNGGVASSPLVNGAEWHYALGHWVEDDGLNGDDGSFSSPGAAGWYPWINAAKTQYGILARYEQPNGATAMGQASQACALLIRTAWNDGIKQCGATPGTSC